jgi:hypothetical protein
MFKMRYVAQRCKLGDMLALQDMPAVDVYVPTYSGEFVRQLACYFMLRYLRHAASWEICWH